MMLVDAEPLPIDCDPCGGTGQRNGDWCMACGGVGCDWFDRTALYTLAHNLAWAASLCAALDIGLENACDWSCDEPCIKCWRPGCGRSAPE